MASNPLAPLADLIGSRVTGQTGRTVISAVEQEIITLPEGVVKPDGSLDVYDDVTNLFRPTYHKNRPSIQCAGWIGFIPLNDRFALDVSPRVPIGNLERLLGLASGYAPTILHKYSRRFDHIAEQPASLIDVLADQLTAAFDRVSEYGLMKTYERRLRIGAYPFGRILPFETAVRSSKSGRPNAVSTAYHRTIDNGPNRVLRYAFEKLLGRYVGTSEARQRSRVLRLRRAFERLESVSHLSRSESTPQAIAKLVSSLPAEPSYYADALMIAQLVIFDAGPSIRGDGNAAILPSILVDMAKVFEEYMRRVLASGLQTDERIEVRDGNRGGTDGARLDLFDPAAAGTKNPTVTPDIVILREGRAKVIIDAKYKGAPAVPDRNDINQVILYGARYDAPHVMLLHAERPRGRAPVELCGKVGDYSVYNGMIDLSAKAIEDEESAFVQAVKNIM